jgi:hypothetical protein
MGEEAMRTIVPALQRVASDLAKEFNAEENAS